MCTTLCKVDVFFAQDRFAQDRFFFLTSRYKTKNGRHLSAKNLKLLMVDLSYDP